jgi:alkanesulfonate monooxygenase SsuD/methylene tetrahydromethanopterin reductase-like flavin-dependent oxidoreductase (luciferase family)
MAMISMRYDLRRAPVGLDGVGEDVLYRTALDQIRWADEKGIDVVALSEHHVTPQGFLPSPMVFAAAAAAVTERVAITIAALLAPLHHPVALAEDLAVLDHVAGGRVSTVLGLGYRAEELAVFDVAPGERVARLVEAVRVLRQAWSGEPFEHAGQTVVVRPLPRTPGGPLIMLGGSVPAAARRAARLGLPFLSAIDDPELARAYEDENERLGQAPIYCGLPKGPAFVHVSDDPERDWARIGPYALADATAYASWQAAGNRSIVESAATTVDELRAEGKYVVVTPDECRAMLDGYGPLDSFVLHPLMGGIDPELSWAGLELFADEVLPHLRAPAPAPAPAPPVAAGEG